MKIFSSVSLQGSNLPVRSEIAERYKWHTADIFPSDAAWEAGFQQVEKQLPALSAFTGKLGDSAKTLLAALQLRYGIEELLQRLYLYAWLKSDEDTRVSTYQAMRDRVTALATKFNQAAAFIQPEILTLPEEGLRAFMAENRELQAYEHYFDNVLRIKPYTLPREQEQLLALAGDMAQGPYTIFSMFNNADIKFPAIEDENGQMVEVTKGRYAMLMESRHRRVRRDAFSAMYSTYGNWTNTLAASLSTAVKRNIFYSRARKYPSARHAALDENNIPVEVYDNVIQSVNAHLDPLHRYMRLRKEMLQLEALHPWDLYVPLVSEVKMEFSYEDALEMIREGLQPLGETYLAALEQAMQDHWIDVYENQGKRSGAYSWSTYGVHPYILLNYNNTLNNVFTLVHELGHALHSHFTNQHQPFHYSSYTIFVAEVASILNETLLMNHLLKTTKDPRKKWYLLNQQVDQIRGTVYNQALFAEFEMIIHEQVEKGEALTAEYLSDLTRELYIRYFGDAFVMDTEFAINWCRIPHFYYNFYVYQYATGMSAATALSHRILAGDRDARDAYLRFLTRGCSDYSINLLQDAGVDMTSPEPIRATTTLMQELLQEMEKLQTELKKG